MKIRVYQIDGLIDNEHYLFAPYSIAIKKGGVKPEIYKLVYDGGIERNSLEGVFEALNCDIAALEKPEGYKGRSLSMSDIVEVITEGNSSFHYVDRFGFQKINFNSSKCIQPHPVTKSDIEAWLSEHQIGTFCPRCGRDTMSAIPTCNALSRRAAVYICDSCGTIEALEDMKGSGKLPLEEWAITALM